MRKARLVGVLVAGGVFGACGGSGQPPDQPSAAATPSSAAAQVLPVEAQVVHRDEERDLPTFAWVTNRPGASFALHAGTPVDTAWGTLRAIAPAYRLGDAAVAAATLERLHDTGRGPIIAQFTQRVEGVDVFGSRMGVAMGRDTQPIAVTGALVPAAQPLGNRHIALDAPAAVASAYEAMTASRISTADVASLGAAPGGYERHALAVAGSGHARTRRVWFPQPKGLEPAWYVELDVGHADRPDSSLWAFVVSAHDGKVLFQKDMIAADTFSYRVWADSTGPYGLAPQDSPFGNGGTPHPSGLSTDNVSLPYIGETLVTLQNIPFSRNDPWLAPTATELKGNNVFAYADLAAPDGWGGAGDVNVPLTGAKTFDRPYDPTKAPDVTQEQIRAATTHLFFTVNYMHDFFYDAGYDEASGNAQADNYGRGGVGGDPINAEAQDYSGTDNANASTPADGESPRIQMYRWTQTNPGRDGDVDTTIISHEWGHTLSNRLIGNGAGISNNQGGGMGEGWSDFVALLTITRATDVNVASNSTWNGVYAMGAYAFAGTNPHYYGIRRYPYSTDMTKDPLTFKHIANGTALPTNPPPNGFGGANAEVHNTGEIWATMLWECYTSLLKVPGRTFVDANQRMRNYLVAGLKLTPNAPTFVEARDAILAAIYASDPADFQLCAAGFAKRGIGTGAIAPPRTSTTNSPVTESYKVGNDLQFVSAEIVDGPTNCDSDGVLDNGETARLKVRVRNVGMGNLSATTGTVTSTSGTVTIANAGKLTFPASKPYQTVEAAIDVSMAGATGPTTVTFNIGVTDPGLLNVRTITGSLTHIGNSDFIPNSSATDHVDGPSPVWSLGADAALDTSTPWRRVATADGGQQWFWPDAAPTSDMYLISPPLVVGTGAFSFTFKNRWQFEQGNGYNFDGGVLELSQDGGATWTDIGSKINNPNGYNGTISTDAGAGTKGNNPLLGRMAYIGSKTTAVTSTVNLGTTYAGKTVQIRFRGATDQGGGNVGWELDDLAFTGITNTPFTSRVGHRGLCGGNHAPVANAGPDQTVVEGTLVTLAGSGTDADGDALTFTWSQTGGPTVVLSSVHDAHATFTAPAVTADSVVTLALMANDGKVDSAPSTVKITVKPKTPPPPLDMAMTPDLSDSTPRDLASGDDLASAPANDFAVTDDLASAPAPDLASAPAPDLAQAPPSSGCSCDVSARGGAPASGPVWLSLLFLLGLAARRVLKD
jgi:Fungalysin metallopeptidase (M36)